ncbi:release factor glutamine methyltransferase [Knoellia remsis]|uniref:Release factor glutamine methyltransferase n=1 Tax=Knoellia remsis TaxID=407159 RepID=A0A2T0U4Y5_9MICO|nr:HemK2/MTQ2 family protein methyltransferase [Knoellia remsis]PRY52954.1 release factor glutamine methyltransferase [Knoellia remsis]
MGLSAAPTRSAPQLNSRPSASAGTAWRTPPAWVRLPGCYVVQADTWLLADTLSELGLAEGADVLDLCTGTGALAVAAAAGGADSVTAVDLSMRSVTSAWLNSRRHGSTVRVLRGDLFSVLGDETFDVVVCNPPYVPAATSRLPRHTMARCWDAGPDGRLLLDRICSGVGEHLRPGGSFLVVHSTVSDEERTVDQLEEQGLEAEVVRRASVPFGPVMRSRAADLHSRNLIAEGQDVEEIVVVHARQPVEAAEEVAS